MSDGLLSLHDVACGRGGLTVLSGVSFTLAAGEAAVLRGPNGSGKTTLLRTIARLQLPYQGEIACDPDSIAYAGHADGLKGTLSVRENLQFWAQLFGTDRITSALDAFDLASLAERRAQALSAGQKRRLGLARLMITERPLWILDEPTVSLDTASVALFAAAVRAHLNGGGAALMATHIDLGLDAREIDVTDFKPTAKDTRDFDEAFL